MIHLHKYVLRSGRSYAVKMGKECRLVKDLLSAEMFDDPKVALEFAYRFPEQRLQLMELVLTPKVVK